MTAHLREMQLRFTDLHERITATSKTILNQPVAAAASCAQLSQLAAAMDRDHNAWSEAYFTELRQIFGPDSPAEAQAMAMVTGIGRWIAQDRMYLLLCGSTAALLMEHYDQALDAALDGLRRCDELQAQAQGPDLGDPALSKLKTELPRQRMMLLAQVMLTNLKRAAGPPENLDAAAAAESWAVRTHEQALAVGAALAALGDSRGKRIAWLTAAQALTCAASAGLIKSDRDSFIAWMKKAVQFSDAHQVVLGPAARGPSYTDYLRNWVLSAESTMDRTGEADHRANEVAEQVLASMDFEAF
jgi:hypothetical protein